jgi:septal ring factor EnvC (AmiA/AmiB activator)
MYRSWKSAWKTDWKYFYDLLETTHKQHNADLADLRTEIKTWETSFSQLQEGYHNSCDKGVEQLNQINYLQDKLAKSANRVALTEGKLRAKSSKERAMELTLAFLCDAENEDLPGLVDATWKVIHKNIVQQ